MWHVILEKHVAGIWNDMGLTIVELEVQGPNSMQLQPLAACFITVVVFWNEVGFLELESVDAYVVYITSHHLFGDYHHSWRRNATS